MVQQHIRRAGGIGRGEIADHGIEAEQRLDRLRLEPLIEDLRGRACEQVYHIALRGEVELVQTPREAQRLPQVGQPAPGVGRRDGRNLAQHARHAIKHGLVAGEIARIAFGEPRKLRLGIGLATRQETVAVRQWQEIAYGPLKDP
jgi:hypothetical protein